MIGWLKETVLLILQLLGQCFCFGVVFVAVMYLFHRQMSFFRGWRFRIGGFVAVMFLGIFFYATHPVKGDDGRCLASVNRALSSFFRSQGGFETFEAREVPDKNVGKKGGDGEAEKEPPNEKKAPGMDLYYVYHLLVAFYLAGLTFSFYGREFWNAGFRWWYRKNVAVIWGWSKRGELLARDLIERHHMRVLFILDRATLFDDAKRGDLLDRFGKMNRGDGSAGISCHDCIFWDFEDFENPSVTAAKGKIHCFLSDSGRANIALANQVIAHLQNNTAWLGSIERPTKIYVRVESSADEEYFSAWVVEQEKDKRIEIVVIRESAVIAETFVRKHSVDPNLPQFHVLLLGLGVNGANVLDRIIENSQWEGRKFGVDVVERDVEKWNRYVASRVAIDEQYNVVNKTMESGEVGTVRFDDWLCEKIQSGAYDRIVACLGDDAASISFCLRLSRIYESCGTVDKDSQGCVTRSYDEGTGNRLPRINNKIPAGLVYVQVDEDERGGFFKKYSGQSNIEFFGTLEDVYRVDSIIDPTIEDVAMRLNWWYCHMRNSDENADLMPAWREASWFNRQSSRAAALGQEHLVRYLGYDIEPNSSSPHCDMHDSLDVLDELREKLADDNRLTVLARNEHLRWMAFHHVRGIRRWDLQNPPVSDLLILKKDGKGKIRENQVESFRSHAALVPFDELPSVDLQLARAVKPDGDWQEGDFVGPYAERSGEDAQQRGRTHERGLNYTNKDYALQAVDYGFCRSIPDNLKAVSKNVRVVRK